LSNKYLQHQSLRFINIDISLSNFIIAIVTTILLGIGTVFTILRPILRRMERSIDKLNKKIDNSVEKSDHNFAQVNKHLVDMHDQVEQLVGCLIGIRPLIHEGEKEKEKSLN